MGKVQKGLTDTEEPLEINATEQATEQKEKNKSTGPSGPSGPDAAAEASARRNRILQRNRAYVERMAGSFKPINARTALPDAEVVQTAGKSNYKIQKEKRKLARARNSIADDESYDLKLRANRQLTAVRPAVNSVIEADHIDMTKEENVYRCAIAQCFMKETENDADKFFLRNFLSDDTDTRFIAFHEMVENIRSIEFPKEKLSTEYVLSHLEEIQDIFMRVEAFDNFWKQAKRADSESSRKDLKMFDELNKRTERAILESKIEMGQHLGRVLQCALMQKGLRYVDDPASPFNNWDYKEKYSGLYQMKKLDYCSKEEAKELSRQAGKQIKEEKERARVCSNYPDFIYVRHPELRLAADVRTRARQTPLPRSVKNRVKNEDQVETVREFFTQEASRDFFSGEVRESNQILDSHPEQIVEAGNKLAQRRGEDTKFKEGMSLAFPEIANSMREYYNSIRLDCVDVAPKLKKIENFAQGDVFVGCGTERISRGFLEVLKAHMLSPTGIEFCRNMCEQLSDAKVFFKDGKSDEKQIIHYIYTSLMNTFLADTFAQYRGSNRKVAESALNVFMKSAAFVPENTDIPEEAPEEVHEFVNSYRDLTDQILSRIHSA